MPPQIIQTDATPTSNNTYSQQPPISNFQFRSLGSIEEESPRWTHPPQPECQTNHQQYSGEEEHRIVLMPSSDSSPNIKIQYLLD